MWGFWNKAHWKPDAAIVDGDDLVPNLAGEAYMRQEFWNCIILNYDDYLSIFTDCIMKNSEQMKFWPTIIKMMMSLLSNSEDSKEPTIFLLFLRMEQFCQLLKCIQFSVQIGSNFNKKFSSYWKNAYEYLIVYYVFTYILT